MSAIDKANEDLEKLLQKCKATDEKIIDVRNECREILDSRVADMDKEYLKMILALPEEFFNVWEWNDGDQVYLIDEIDEYSCSEEHGLYTIFDGLICNDGFTCTENWLYVRAIDFKNGRPIPSQKQLINMIKDHSMLKSVKLTDIEVMGRVVSWHDRRDPKHTQKKCCEQLYLDVLMWLNDKTWNGEKWI